jgi:hypothetical protein
VLIGVGQQRQVTRTLDGRGQLTLVTGFGAGDAAGDNLAGFGNEVLQDSDVFVIHFLNAFGSENGSIYGDEQIDVT